MLTQNMLHVLICLTLHLSQALEASEGPYQGLHTLSHPRSKKRHLWLEIIFIHFIIKQINRNMIYLYFLISFDPVTLSFSCDQPAIKSYVLEQDGV